MPTAGAGPNLATSKEPGITVPERNGTWSVGIGYAPMFNPNGATLSAATLRTTDSFPLNGVIPPLAPYRGSFTGPGPLLSTAATRSTALLPGTATVAGNREIDADMFSFGYGPWIAFEPIDRLWIELEAGMTLAVIDGEFSHFTTTTAPNGRTGTATGNGSRTTVLPGFHAGLSAIYQIDDQWDVLLHGRYQYLNDFAVHAGRHPCLRSRGLGRLQ